MGWGVLGWWQVLTCCRGIGVMSGTLYGRPLWRPSRAGLSEPWAAALAVYWPRAWRLVPRRAGVDGTRNPVKGFFLRLYDCGVRPPSSLCAQGR